MADGISLSPGKAALADRGTRHRHHGAARLGDPDSAQVAGVVPDRPVLLPDRIGLRAHGRLQPVLNQTVRWPWIADAQLGSDAVMVSALVYLTGGVTSYFSTLYTLPIIAASTVRSWRGGLLVGILSSILYTGLVLAQYLRWAAAFGHPGPGHASALEGCTLSSVGLNVFGLVAVAVLSGYLAEGLRRADVRLQQASDQLADLQAFSQHVIDSLASGLMTTNASGCVMTFNLAAETITGIGAAAAVGQPAASVLQLPPDVATMFDPDKGGERCHASSSRSRVWTAGRLSWGSARRFCGRHAARTAFCSRSGTSPKRARRNGRRGSSNGWRQWGRWPQGSPTRSGTRWRRCRARSISSVRSCR